MMHLDECEKFWTPKFKEYAKHDELLQLMRQHYAYYVRQLHAFEGLDEMQRNFADINEDDSLDAEQLRDALAKIDIRARLQKLVNEIDTELKNAVKAHFNLQTEPTITK